MCDTMCIYGGRIMDIKTERLLLVPISKDYANDMYVNFNEKVTLYMSPCPAKNIKETNSVIKSFVKKRNDNTDYIYAILLKESREFIGCVGLHDLNSEAPELGIWTKLSVHGNYYGREAIGGVIQFAKSIGYKKAIYPVDRRNIASKKIPIYFNGQLIIQCEEKTTSDGRILERETYQITIL